MTTHFDQPQADTGALVIYRPLVEKTLAALGALVTHQLAYLAVSLVGAHPDQLSDHRHMATQWAVVTPLAVAGAAGLVVWQLRSLGFRSSVAAGHLGGWIAGFFLIQELIEGLAGGHSLADVSAHPAIAAGLVIGPIVGWLMSRVLAGVTELAARLLVAAEFLSIAARPVPAPIPVHHTTTAADSPSRPRAPPSTLRT